VSEFVNSDAKHLGMSVTCKGEGVDEKAMTLLANVLWRQTRATFVLI